MRSRKLRRPGEAIQTDDDQGLARADIAQEAGEDGSGAIGAGGVLLKDGVAVGGVELVALGIGALLFGRETRA